MSKNQSRDLESLELRVKKLEKSLQEVLKEVKSLNTRLERLESLPHNRPKDILIY
jgi:chaperonin cofactor prefoldin